MWSFSMRPPAPQDRRQGEHRRRHRQGVVADVAGLDEAQHVTGQFDGESRAVDEQSIDNELVDYSP
jgi:hypothetical protein